MLADLIKKLFNHERYQSLAVITVIVLLAIFFGCESKVTSINNPTQKVTRAELQLELDVMIAKCKIGLKKLDRQDELRNLILQQALITASTGTINPLALITSLGTILGIGATVDNVRKRKDIKKIKTTGEIPV